MKLNVDIRPIIEAMHESSTETKEEFLDRVINSIIMNGDQIGHTTFLDEIVFATESGLCCVVKNLKGEYDLNSKLVSYNQLKDVIMASIEFKVLPDNTYTLVQV